MFRAIFFHELRHWIKHPIPYVCGIFLFAFCLVSMWGMAGEETSGPNLVVQNSETRLHYLISFINQLFLFMLAAIMGHGLSRDITSRMHTVLFSYPFSKYDYLLAKFASSFLVLICIGFTVALGLMIGSQMPGVNPDAIDGLALMRYLKLYGLLFIPNFFLVSVAVFYVVAQTRNIYSGFVVVIGLVIFNIILGNFSSFAFQLIDPLGEKLVKASTKFWTLSERNNESLPITWSLMLNRICWLGLSILGGVLLSRKFVLGQFNSRRKGKEVKSEVGSRHNSTKFKIPKVTFHHNFWSRLKVIWSLSNYDLKFILFSWPFAILLGILMVAAFIQQSGMAPQNGVPILPTTSEMLRIPMFIFSGAFNLLIFLYSGILIYRGRRTRMASLMDSCPVPEYVFLLSVFATILKMILVLLSIMLFTGVAVQIMNGYYRIELSHYLFELYVINFIHFSIWATVAILVHSIFNNLYVSLLICLLIPIGILMMPAASDYLNIDFLNESFLHFNHVPGLYVGFEYSDFNAYGTALPVYFFYKSYWAIGAALIMLFSLLFWKRGSTFSFKERLAIARNRLIKPLSFATAILLVLFISMGANVYYQEHCVSKIFYTDEEEDYVYAENEKRYGHFLDRPQPRLVDAKLNMDIYPSERNYRLEGRLFYVNKLGSPIDTILIGTSFKDSVNIDLKNPSRLLHHDFQLRYYTYILDDPLNLGDTLEMEIKVQNHPNTLLHDNSRVNTNGTFITGQIIPTLGVRQAFLTNPSKRAEYNLPKREVRDILPSDTTLLGYEFFSNNMGRIKYETTITTSAGQQAFSMGILEESGEDEGRAFFKYKSDGLITNTISWLSGTYALDSGEYMDIYHHPEHSYNLEYLREGAIASKDYCEKWFSPLEHDKLKMIEFPITVGTYATLNGNMIPVSENKMLCDIDHEKNTEYNHPFFVAAHEVAHYWWGHQVDPANVKGGQLISESMAEYISKKVVEARYGKEVIRKDRAKEQDTYFEIRAREAREVPLNIAGLDQQYLNYVKGGLVLTTISEYIGEERFNDALSRFHSGYRYIEPPFPTSLNFIDTIRSAMPDSLLCLIEDLFETITVYDNKILRATQKGEQLEVEVEIRKFRTNGVGDKEEVIDFTDYIKLGFVNEDGEELHEIVKVTSGVNIIDIKLGNVKEVLLDPDVLLLDPNREDQRMKVNK